MGQMLGSLTTWVLDLNSTPCTSLALAILMRLPIPIRIRKAMVITTGPSRATGTNPTWDMTIKKKPLITIKAISRTIRTVLELGTVMRSVPNRACLTTLQLSARHITMMRKMGMNMLMPMGMG
jgi:hypothetical protein